MDREDLHLVPRRELAAILDYLKDPALRGVLVLGKPGTGKTTLLAMAAQELSSQGRPVFGVPLGSVRYPGDLGVRMVNAIAASPYKDAVDVERTLRSSHGDVPLTETAAILNRASARLPSPVLLMDALDESVFPSRVASAIEQLSLELDDWKFVVASRLGAAEELRRLRSFSVLELRGLAGVDAADILRASAPSLPADIIARITEFAGGNPVLLQAVARDLQRSASLATAGDGASSLADALEWLVNEAVSESADPAKLGELLEELALAGGRERIAALAVKSRITDGEVSRLLDAPRARALVVLDDPAGMAALFHDACGTSSCHGRFSPPRSGSPTSGSGTRRRKATNCWTKPTSTARTWKPSSARSAPSWWGTAALARARSSAGWRQAPPPPMVTRTSASCRWPSRTTCSTRSWWTSRHGWTPIRSVRPGWWSSRRW